MKLFAALAVGFFLLWSGPASAKSQEWVWCEGPPGTSPDHQIAGCTAAIQSGKEPARNLAVAFNNRANAYVAKRDYERAIQDYSFAIKLFPDYAEALYNRGLAYDAKERFDLAVEDFDQVIALIPSAADAYNGRCSSRAHAGKQLQAALADCNAALAMRPGHPASLDARCFVHYRMGGYDEALADCDGALAADPNMASALFVRGLAKMEIDEDGAGDIAAAEALDANIRNEFARYGVAVKSPAL
jgi:tetratricopeptide (TPR) repeat protein